MGDWVIKQTSAKSWFITGTVALGVPLVLGLKGQPAQTYVLSFFIGCLPLCVLAYIRPFFNPYSNFLTQRDEDEISAEKQASLEVLRTSRGRRAVLQTAGAVAIVLFSLFLLRNNSFIEQVPLGRHTGSYSGTIYGTALTFGLTLGYLPFFWSRILREYIEQGGKRIG